MDTHLPMPAHAGTSDLAEPRRRRRRIMALLLGLSTVSLGAGLFTLAIFTDSDASGGGFASGSIDIEANPTVAFAVTAMVPGDQVTAPLTISNDGTSALRYALTSVATTVLGDALTLEVRALGTSCAVFDGGVVLAATALDGATFGNPAQGADAGDRTLAAAANEVLCFRVAFPIGSGNALQGLSSTATFTFDAEQTANNP